MLDNFTKGIKKFLNRLQGLLVKHGVIEAVIVGYAQPYAIFVHEATAMKLKGVLRSKSRRRPSLGRYWDPKGQAKFLEAPARRMHRELGIFIGESIKKGLSFQVGTFKAGLKLQHESQKLVPIDFGALIASAYTAKESKESQVAGSALLRSIFLRPEPGTGGSLRKGK